MKQTDKNRETLRLKQTDKNRETLRLKQTDKNRETLKLKQTDKNRPRQRDTETEPDRHWDRAGQLKDRLRRHRQTLNQPVSSETVVCFNEFRHFIVIFSLVNMMLNVHRNRKAYKGRGEGGEGRTEAVSYTHLTLPTMAVV